MFKIGTGFNGVVVIFYFTQLCWNEKKNKKIKLTITIISMMFLPFVMYVHYSIYHETDFCLSEPCQNGGNCTGFDYEMGFMICDCPVGFTGEFCQISKLYSWYMKSINVITYIMHDNKNT